MVADYQQVHKGDVLVQSGRRRLQAQVAHTEARVEATKAALENNHRQRELLDSRINRALAEIDQAKPGISAAQAGKDAVQADVVRTRAERTRQSHYSR